VVHELSDLHNSFGVRQVLFEDEQPLEDRDRWLEICDRLRASRLDLIWSCPNGLRPEALDHEMLVAMADGGCRHVALGLESTESNVLARLGRHSSLEPASQVARYARELGIDITAYFMLGLPGQALGAGRAMLRTAASLGACSAHFNIFVPVQGSVLTARRPHASLRLLRMQRTALYLAWYGHPGRLASALRHADAGPRDLLAGAGRLRAWLGFGREATRSEG